MFILALDVVAVQKSIHHFRFVEQTKSMSDEWFKTFLHQANVVRKEELSVEIKRWRFSVAEVQK